MGFGCDARGEEVAEGVLGESYSTHAIGAGAEEFEEVEVSEDLELLADFVVDVAEKKRCARLA